jgi:CNT family concentrative nucleoside transporter
MIGWLGDLAGFSIWGQGLIPDVLREAGQVKLTLQLILGWMFAPFACLLGIPWSEATLAGAIIGEKTALNEFVAYLRLVEFGKYLSDRSFVILSYALCGFANFASIAIQVGGIGSMAPSRRTELAQFGIKAIIGGTLASFMTGAMVGLFL